MRIHFWPPQPQNGPAVLDRFCFYFKNGFKNALTGSAFPPPDELPRWVKMNELPALALG